MTALDHPNIVATFDAMEHNGRLCLIQEWIDGGSLADELGLAGQLGLTETVRLGREVASALRYAHQRGILHRDIKPSNVLRTVEGTYKLTDFGAFGQLQVETATTRAGEIAGTPLYMSPEQITGAPQSAASDLFGFGLLLYRCLHGHLPDDMAGSYLQLARSRMRTPMSVPPSPLQGLLERCLALDPAQRPRSAAEVLTELDQIAPIPPSDAPARQWWDVPPPSPSDWEPPWEVQHAQQRPLGRDWDRRHLDRQKGRRDGRRGLPAPPQGIDRAQGAPKSLPRTQALAPWAALVGLAVAVLVAGIALLGVGNGLVRVGAGLAIAGVALAVATDPPPLDQPGARSGTTSGHDPLRCRSAWRAHPIVDD